MSTSSARFSFFSVFFFIALSPVSKSRVRASNYAAENDEFGFYYTVLAAYCQSMQFILPIISLFSYQKLYMALYLSEKRRGFKRTAPPKLSKNPGELERAAALSNFQSSPAACTVGAGLFYRREIPFSGEKIASLQVLRPEPEGFKQNLRGGGSGGGACSPVHQLVKKTFLTS